jgi:hypothetical protein
MEKGLARGHAAPPAEKSARTGDAEPSSTAVRWLVLGLPQQKGYHMIRLIRRFVSLPARGPLTQEEKLQRDNQNVLAVVLTLAVLLLIGGLPIALHVHLFAG